MKMLEMLTRDQFISIAKLVDNNFIGNSKILVRPMKLGVVSVVGHTEGGQCVNAEVKVDIFFNKLRGVYIMDSDSEILYRHVYSETFLRVIDFLQKEGFSI